VLDLDLHFGRNLLASVANDGTMRLWDVPTGKSRRVINSVSVFNSVDFSSDSSSILTADESGNVQLWSTSGEPVMRIETGEGWAYAALSRNDRLISVSKQSEKLIHYGISVYDVDTSTEYNKPRWKRSKRTFGSLLSSAHDNAFITADFFPYRLTSSIVWIDYETGREIRKLPTYFGKIFDFCVSADERLIAIAGSDPDRPLEVWDVALLARIFALRGDTVDITAVAISPDGALLASGSDDQTIQLWALETGQRLQVLRGHVGAINDLVFTADSRTLVSGSSDHTIKFWNVANVK
jgi:WD40 repeat protein